MLRQAAWAFLIVGAMAAGPASALQPNDFACDPGIGKAAGRGYHYSKPYVRISGLMRPTSFPASAAHWSGASVGFMSEDKRHSTNLRVLQNGFGMQEYNLGEEVDGTTTWIGVGTIAAPVKFVIDVAPRVGARFTVAGKLSRETQPAPARGLVVYQCETGVFSFENLLIEESDTPLPPFVEPSGGR